jgi:26S proteasome regulatory subunit T5
MSSQEPPRQPESTADNKDVPQASGGSQPTTAAHAMDTTSDLPPQETWEDIPTDVMAAGTDEIMTRTRLIDNDIKVKYSLLFTGCLAKRD